MSSTMLELAISMIFLYLMLSAGSSAIQEIIANLFRWRAKTLEKGIAGLFDQVFKNELYKLPLIEALCSPNARGKNVHPPSYIAASTFALAVLDLAAKNDIALPGTAPAPGATSPPSSATLPIESIERATMLLTSLLRGATDVQEQRQRIESWFNDSMDRVSGWYKRTSYAWLWIIGVVVCLLVNADSITLGGAFWNDPTLRAATVAAATEHVKNAQKEEKPQATGGNNDGAAAAPGGAATPASDQTGNTNSSDDGLKGLDAVRRELSTSKIPLGWCWGGDKGERKCFPFSDNSVVSASSPSEKKSVADPRMVGTGFVWWVWKFLGIALTALAISQGAPFWFDMLQKVVNLRLAGDAPDEKTQSSK